MQSTPIAEKRLRLLQIEDSANDAELMLCQIREAGFAVESQRVESGDELLAALTERQWDLVLSDYNLPRFSAEEALAIVRAKCDDLPLIVVSGCIGEETAVAMMRQGANDYLMKDNLTRLAPAIERELGDAAARRQRYLAEEALRAKDKLLHDITFAIGEGIIVVDQAERVMFMNPKAESLLGWSEMELFGRTVDEVFHGQPVEDEAQNPEERYPMMTAMHTGGIYQNDDAQFRRKDGAMLPVAFVTTPIMTDGAVVASVTAFQDITRRKEVETELNESRRQLRDLSAFLQTVREEERAHIARELHDELGQMLTAFKMDLLWLSSKLNPRQTALVQKVSTLAELVDASMNAVHRIASDLRPWLLDDLGLGAAIEWQMEQFRERNGMAAELSLTPEDIEVEEPLATGIFRIVQEALTNVARHAGANQVAVSLRRQEEALVLKIKDNGQGMAADYKPKRDSYGLIGMRERTYNLGGQFQMASAPGEGTAIEIHFPVIETELGSFCVADQGAGRG